MCALVVNKKNFKNKINKIKFQWVGSQHLLMSSQSVHLG